MPARRAFVLVAFLALALQGLSLGHGLRHAADAPSCSVCVVSAQPISVDPEISPRLGSLLGLFFAAEEPKLALSDALDPASSARGPPAPESPIPI